jgi:hypothetical protein
MTTHLNIALAAAVSSFVLTPAYAQFDFGKLKDAAKQMQADVEGKGQPQPPPTAAAPQAAQKPTAPVAGTNSLLQSIIKLVVVPETDGVGTAQSWENLNAVMPSAKWAVSQDKRYPFAKATSIKDKTGTVKITVGGARTMVTEASAAFSADYEIDIDKFLASSVKSKQVCVIEDMASAKDIYYEVTLSGYKPTIFHYEFSSGSGGGFDTVSIGSIDLPKACSKASAKSGWVSSEAKPTQASGELVFGYLKGTIKTFDGAGCTYVLGADDKKKGEQKPIAASPYEDDGVVLNINGQDVLVKMQINKGAFTGTKDGYKFDIPNGKTVRCGEECSKTFTNLQVSNGQGYKKSIPIVSYCGS